MNIAINTLPLYKTKVGMGRYVVELINRVPLSDQKNQYIIYISQENKTFFTIPTPNVTPQTVPALFTFPLLKIVWEQLFLPFSLRKNAVDLYHAPGFVLPFWKPKGMRYIVTIADMTFFTHLSYHTFFKKIYFQSCIPSSLKKADAIIAISENTKKDIIELQRINPEKIKVTLLGVDALFRPMTVQKYTATLKKYNIHGHYILFVGMLEPRKNVEGLLHAFSQLKDRKNHVLVIVGKKGWMYEKIFSLVKKLQLEQNVVFTGYVPDEELPALYSAATCFVYPSFYEGFGIPVLEAMACGCPVITSNNSSLKEIAGNAAFFIDPKNTEQIAEKIQVLLNSPKEREKRKDEGMKQAKKYTWDSFARRTKEIYHQVIKND